MEGFAVDTAEQVDARAFAQRCDQCFGQRYGFGFVECVVVQHVEFADQEHAPVLVPGVGVPVAVFAVVVTRELGVVGFDVGAADAGAAAHLVVAMGAGGQLEAVRVGCQRFHAELVQQLAGATFGRGGHAHQQQGAAADETEQGVDLGLAQVARIEIEHDGTVFGRGEVGVAEAQAVEHRVLLRDEGAFEGKQAVASRLRTRWRAELERHLMEVREEPPDAAREQAQTEPDQQQVADARRHRATHPAPS